MERTIRILFKSPLVSMFGIEIFQRFKGSAPITLKDEGADKTTTAFSTKLYLFTFYIFWIASEIKMLECRK